jgi:hypothetical protein
VSSLAAISDGPNTEREYVLSLCSYITDNAAIASHANRNFGGNLTAVDVGRIRARLPKKPR